MKLNVSDDEIKEVEHVIFKAFGKGATIGLGISGVANVLGNKYSPYYRSLRMPLKAFFVMAMTIGWGITKVEHHVWEYDRRKYSGEYMAKLDEIKQMTDEMPWKDRAMFYVSDNKFKVLGTTWATVVSGTVAYLYNHKYLDRTQKAIYARMYSQAITVIMILATAGLVASPKQMERERFERDQWKQVLGPEPTPELLKKPTSEFLKTPELLKK